MKVFAVIVVFLSLTVAVLCAEDTKSRSLFGEGAHGPHGVASSYSFSAPYPGAGAVAGLPCPNNYLFSCQPQLQPAPCSHTAPTYGSVGAYSDNYPVYALQVPQYVNGYQAY